jgi:hypothetical protein
MGLFGLFSLSGLSRLSGFYSLFGQLYLTMEAIPPEWNLTLRAGSETSSGILFAGIIRISGSSKSIHHLFGFWGFYGPG